MQLARPLFGNHFVADIPETIQLLEMISLSSLFLLNPIRASALPSGFRQIN